jgi:hypothetical protein
MRRDELATDSDASAAGLSATRFWPPPAGAALAGYTSSKKN